MNDLNRIRIERITCKVMKRATRLALQTSRFPIDDKHVGAAFDSVADHYAMSDSVKGSVYANLVKLGFDI